MKFFWYFQEPNPWSCIATLTVISKDVYDVQEIIQCLLVPMSQCTSIEILECLYCIATLLYQFKLCKVDDVWNGLVIYSVNMITFFLLIKKYF